MSRFQVCSDVPTLTFFTVIDPVSEFNAPAWSSCNLSLLLGKGGRKGSRFVVLLTMGEVDGDNA